VAAALVALFPRFVFLSPFVTNDNLVTFLGAVLTWCALRFIERPSWGRMAVVGGVFGLLITTKLSVLPVGLLLFALPFAVSPWARRLWLAVTGVLAALLVSSWYLAQNWVLYGDPLARHATENYLIQVGGLGTGLSPYVVKDPLHLVFVDVPNLFATNFWYTSGWNQFHWSKTVGIVIALVVGVVLFGLFGQHIDRRALLLLGIITVLSLACVWFVAFQTATYQPRYALVGLAAMAILVALALQRWPLWMRWLLPAAGFIGCLVATRLDVLDVHWT
jgi:4-amino-4-deoxy-L-arabinose transferase-like glycosyltransferase